MEEETILESIFFDREQRVLANVSDEERNVILEIERDGNEDKLRKLIEQFKEDRLRNKIEEMLDYALEDVSKRYCASLEKYYKQGFKDGVNLIVIPEYRYYGKKISSSRIRKELENKNYNFVNKLLGYEYKK